MEIYKKNGYLNSEFQIFHLRNDHIKRFENHYHDFHKILIFISGHVSYLIEGREYKLQPNDIILIHSGEIHRPIIHDDFTYERIIIYISPEFFNSYLKDGDNLLRCFDQTTYKSSNLIRLPYYMYTQLKETIDSFSNPVREGEFAGLLYQKIKITEFLILLNRLLSNEYSNCIPTFTANKTIIEIIAYISSHLTGDLNIDDIANELFLHRSYIMHLFKKETGYTVGKYITEKRLFIAKQYIINGDNITEACYKSGFNTYTTFYTAYRKRYNASPKSASSKYDNP